MVLAVSSLTDAKQSRAVFPVLAALMVKVLRKDPFLKRKMELELLLEDLLHSNTFDPRKYAQGGASAVDVKDEKDIFVRKLYNTFENTASHCGLLESNLSMKRRGNSTINALDV